MLFQHLPTKALAGNMAARLFEVQTWVSVGCGLALLLMLHSKRAENDKNVPLAGYRDFPQSQGMFWVLFLFFH